MIFCASCSDSLPGLTASVTDRYPVALSLLSAEAPWVLRGLITDATFGFLATSAAESLTAPAYLESVSWPLEVCRTIGLVPFAWLGNDFARMSAACWLSVPGNDRLSLVLSPSRCETATSTTETTNQTPSTMKRRRTENRPTAYKTPVTLQPPRPFTLVRAAWNPGLPGRDCQGATVHTLHEVTLGRP